MKTSTRLITGSALLIALLSAALGMGMVVLARADSGVRLSVQGDHIVVAEVLPYSSAAALRTTADGIQATWVGGLVTGEPGRIRPGMVVVALNGRTLIRLPANVYPDVAPTMDPATGESPLPLPIGVEPALPEIVVGTGELAGLAAGPVWSLTVLTPEALATWTPDSGASVSWSAPWLSQGSVMAWVAGLLLLVLAGWWLGTGRAGDLLRSIAWPTGSAIAAPLLLWPLDAAGSPVSVALYGVLLPVSMLPMAAAILRLIEARRDRLVAGLGAGAAAIAAAALGLALSPGGLWNLGNQVLVISLLVGAIAFLPALVGAASLRERTTSDGRAERRIVSSGGLLAAGATPFFAVQSSMGPFGFFLPLWLVALVVATRVTVRPLARLAGRANLQRDLVVAATEAERARVAADIHDDALQELTLLVRRLDAAGDAEGAEIARGVSDRLRAICGDLRLPILDDLGVGPALDWLVLRVERIAGGEIRLERVEGPRPPAEVELALFRIAQEALANAVKHGATPIVVRYRTNEGWAALSIDDSGRGIEPDASERAATEGRYGLLNMAQRAEAIGAILDVRRWPAGGTHVRLEWRAP